MKKSNNKQNSTHGTKWNSRFIFKEAYAKMDDLSNKSVIIIFRNVSQTALRRVSDIIKEAVLCDECYMRDGSSIELIRSDLGMMIAIDFTHFLISAFEQENYDLEVEGDYLKT